MRPIITITLNPALDLSLSTPQVTPGPKLRCTAPEYDPGGGGINVSRAIRQIGGESIAFAALGGPTGARIARMLGAEGIECRAFEAPGETRQSIAVTEETSGAQYRFVLPGPSWSSEAQAGLLDALAAQVPESALVVLSGSQPPGLPVGFPARLIDALAPKSASLLIDTSGAAMMTLRDRAVGPEVLRLDGEEAAALAGREIDTLADLGAFAADLVAEGAAKTVILARGAEGNVLADRGLAAPLHAHAPEAPVVSAVGAGDSFMGAFTLATARGLAPGDALRHGTAAAAAAVRTEATRLCDRATFEALLPDTTLTELP
ncbi:1-phosphofructokinase family hexose kinase [Poseidonocella sedimentorum]|uniref:Phosphofructokinase n=1 Tax=Poseidonocella sedimentorum TaxID=871652 RepID=A0A1I6DTW0_9RHOB|nr:1-phosphofructokinase family hexose kinase [Poseidonocella sedimentorum]SFR08899.1 6-phosphofructokinase [Poseidonocella sedimentorum]